MKSRIIVTVLVVLHLTVVALFSDSLNNGRFGIVIVDALIVEGTNGNDIMIRDGSIIVTGADGSIVLKGGGATILEPKNNEIVGAFAYFDGAASLALTTDKGVGKGGHISMSFTNGNGSVKVVDKNGKIKTLP